MEDVVAVRLDLVEHGEAALHHQAQLPADAAGQLAGEGGALLVNDPRFVERAEIIREKGTNRSQFFRGQVDKVRSGKTGSSA